MLRQLLRLRLVWLVLRNGGFVRPGSGEARTNSYEKEPGNVILSSFALKLWNWMMVPPPLNWLEIHSVDYQVTLTNQMNKPKKRHLLVQAKRL